MSGLHLLHQGARSLKVVLLHTDQYHHAMMLIEVAFVLVTHMCGVASHAYACWLEASYEAQLGGLACNMCQLLLPNGTTDVLMPILPVVGSVAAALTGCVSHPGAPLPQPQPRARGAPGLARALLPPHLQLQVPTKREAYDV